MNDNVKENLNTRNYGIDLLRIISMFFIVILHSLGHGGLLNATTAGSAQYKFVWFIEVISYCAVNIFGLISGYVSYTDKEKEFKISNFIKLWLQVVFYGLSFTLIFYFFNHNDILKSDFLKAMTPISFNMYWYFTAYAGLFVLMPFLNKAIRNCDDKLLRQLFILILLVFSVFDTVFNRFNQANGYSVIWLIILYILGAIIKKCGVGKNMKNYTIIIFMAILHAITFLYKMYGVKKPGIFILYTSPTILGIAVLYLIAFQRMKFSSLFQKIIKFSAGSSFAIYLINDNPLIRKYIIKNNFACLANSSIFQISIVIIACAISFVIVSILIDKIRQFLHKILHIDTIINKVSDIINIVLSKISKLKILGS